MVRYLESKEKNRSRKLYEEAFPEDSRVFVDYYYDYVTRKNKILVLEKDGVICSMLHLNPYTLSVNNAEILAYYYVAVATRADCRHQGMMRALLQRSLTDMAKEELPFTYLMPANRAIYEPFDFRIIYEQKKIELPDEPEAANQKMQRLFDVYTRRDDWYMEKQRAEDAACAGEEPFDVIPYIMARITKVERMLALLRAEKPMNVILKVSDEIIGENNGYFCWQADEETGSCHRLEWQNEAEDGQVIKVTIAELTEFVFGKREIAALRAVKKLSRICINEAV